jgi:hypothetical protein
LLLGGINNKENPVNDPIFERCPHDKKNPYVMISREMAQDPSISPKAKGVLLYILSLPNDWKIYHSQLQKGLNVGEECLNSALEELIKEGYADRTREKINGMFQPYRYIIREFKKCSPDRVFRPGSSGPENPVLQSKEAINTKETTTKQAVAASSISEKVLRYVEKDESILNKPKVYECLKEVNIPERDKLEITSRYDEECVKNAIVFATHPKVPIRTTLVQTIKWACSNKPQIPSNSISQKEDNKDYAQKYDGIKSSTVRIDVLNESVEIVYLSCQKSPLEIRYDSKDFITNFQSALKNNGFKV